MQSAKLTRMGVGAIVAGIVATAVAVKATEDGTKLAGRERVLGTIVDFQAAHPGPFAKGFLDSWRWSDEYRAEARTWSRIEVIDTSGDGKSLRVRIDDLRAISPPGMSFLSMMPYFPPEADAVRIRVRVISGQTTLYVGGPTAYYGNSDVFTEPQTIVAADPPRWVEVVCNLNHPTWRNYRRSGFSTDAPRNYYNRWAQEPVGVFVAPGSRGEFHVGRVDLLALGEGRPFAAFAENQIQLRQTIADFEDGRREGTFTLYMAAAESEWFDESWKREKPLRFAPMKLDVVDGGLEGRKSLVCTGRTAEEVHCTGVRAAGDARANALRVSMAIDAAKNAVSLLGAGPVEPIDFFVFVAPKDRKFPWQRFGPADALRSYPGPGFDYQFTYRTLQAKEDVDFAIYQTRRYVEPGAWTRLVLPAADFTCIYGHGAWRDRLLKHAPLDCGEAVAVAWLNPWCRSGRRGSEFVTRLDSLSWAEVPGTPAEHRSFWQVPDVAVLKHRDDSSPGRRIRHVGLPDDQFAP